MLMQTPIRPTAALPVTATVSGRPVALGAIELMGSQMSFAANEEIFGENEPCEYVYKVVSGAVRTYKILADGRRQIGGFYLAGDTFGLEVGTEHHFSAEAINKVVVRVVRRSAIVAQAERDCEAARELWTITARELKS